MNYIFIPSNVPSSKNSKVWTGRFLVSSKTTRNYEKNTAEYWLTLKSTFKDIFSGIYPKRIGFYFVRDSRRRFDYINACQILADLMTEYGWIEDDDVDHFNPFFLGYHHDKEKSGVYLIPSQELGLNDADLAILISKIKSEAV